MTSLTVKLLAVIIIIILMPFIFPFKGPDGHVTKYDLDWLVRNSYEGQKTKGHPT